MRAGRHALVVGVVIGLVLGLTTIPPARAAAQCAPAEEEPIDTESWAQRRIAASRVWPLTEGAVRVAVVDTGVSATAPALEGALLPGADVGGGPSTVDCSGHGTFLAGLLAARPRDGSPFAGVAPGARVIPVRVTDDPAEVDPARLAAGVRAAVDGGARVIAVGLVTAVDHAALRAAVAEAVARDVVVVASAATGEAGNRSYPASLPGVVAVAPVGADGAVRTTPFGAEPALAAPADGLVGIAPGGEGHRVGSAPELAVAYVAGAAALVRDYHPDLTAPEVVGRLLATADRPSGRAPDPVVGHGIVDPVTAVTAVLPRGHPALDPVAERLEVPLPTRPDAAPARRALRFTAALLGAALLLGAVGALVALGRRRAGGSPTPAAGEAR
ncbi:S8 family serine peptidase [Saccharothrix isguenensis]